MCSPDTVPETEVITILSNKEHFGNYRGIVFKNHAADDRIPHFSK